MAQQFAPLKIRARRQELGLSQEALAAQLGVSRAVVSLWDQGIKVPGVRLLPLLARALDWPIGELFADTEDLVQTR